MSDEPQEAVVVDERPAEEQTKEFREDGLEFKDAFVEVDVVDPAPEADNEVVLPSTTSCGETIDVETVEPMEPANFTEVVYSSLPPDLNVEVMNRATRTPHAGINYTVKKTDGLLKILMDPEMVVVMHGYDRQRTCITCNRRIEPNELFLNFPDDLDRRRLWGNALGFKYSEMLRLKVNTGYSLTSIGYICTDHFSEECFRKYNFNKAAIEAFGIPLTFSHTNAVTPKKRPTWDCTICPHRCYSVSGMHKHLVDHANKGRQDPAVNKALNNKGINCPFCRKCTYGYKTIGGLMRHLVSEPKMHFYLKRIFDVAAKNCRSASLEPANDWKVWTEKNLYYAYHGCDVPQKSPVKRPHSGEASGSASPVKRPAIAPSDEGTSISEQSGDDNPAENSQEKRCAVRRLDLSDELNEPSTSMVTMKNLVPNAKTGTAATIEISAHMLSRVKALIPDAIISTESNDEYVVESTSTLADALDYVADEERTEEGLHMITESQIQPIALTHNDQRQYAAKARKTQRQLESSEARLRLFGDETYVEVPRGYKKVETSDGPRLVHVAATKTWEERLAPTVHIQNHRFRPIN